MLKHLKPENAIDITYKGLPILDKNLLVECLMLHGFEFQYFFTLTIEFI